MLADKLTLLEQINTAILKNSCRGEEPQLEEHNNLPGSRPLPESSLENKVISIHDRVGSMNKLEQRLQILESQNDRLLYFIHFLYKNFPELVKDILSTCPDYGKENHQHPAGESFCCNSDQPCLTPREGEILQLVSRGLRAKEIASRLYISESTVITHKKNLKEKFKAKNTAELISKAYHLGNPEDESDR